MLIALLHPSFWQRTLAGLVVIFAVVVPSALVVVWLRRAVFEPWVAGRAWPEGARWVRLGAEVIVDHQRVPLGGGPFDAVFRQGLRFGLVVACCAVVPLSTGLVLTQPVVGVFLVPVALALDAIAGWDRADGDGETFVLLRIGLAGVLGLVAGVAAAQWGTGSLADIVVAQADGSIFGVAGWGLATAWVQPIAFGFAIWALHVTGVTMSESSAVRRGGSVGLGAAFVDAAWIIVGAAWLVAVFGGGGAVPWRVDNDGVRHVLSAMVLLAKVSVVVFVATWAQARFRGLVVSRVRRGIVWGAIGGVVAIAVTVGIRSLV